MTQERKLTAEQRALVQEFKEHYGIEEHEINFDERGEAHFGFEALNLLTLTLAPQIQELSVSQGIQDEEATTCSCFIRLADGRVRNFYATARRGEKLPSGEEVRDIVTAENVARYRALRTGLRGVGFNVLRAHREYVAKGKAELGEEVDQAKMMRMAIHALSDELGLSDEAYREALDFATGRTSTNAMNEQQLSNAHAYLKAKRDAMLRRRAA